MGKREDERGRVRQRERDIETKCGDIEHKTKGEREGHKRTHTHTGQCVFVVSPHCSIQ